MNATKLDVRHLCEYHFKPGQPLEHDIYNHAPYPNDHMLSIRSVGDGLFEALRTFYIPEEVARNLPLLRGSSGGPVEVKQVAFVGSFENALAFAEAEHNKYWTRQPVHLIACSHGLDMEPLVGCEAPIEVRERNRLASLGR